MAMDSPDLDSPGHCCSSHASPSLDSNGSLSPHLPQQLTGRKRQPHPVSGLCLGLMNWCRLAFGSEGRLQEPKNLCLGVTGTYIGTYVEYVLTVVGFISLSGEGRPTL